MFHIVLITVLKILTTALILPYCIDHSIKLHLKSLLKSFKKKIKSLKNQELQLFRA